MPQENVEMVRSIYEHGLLDSAAKDEALNAIGAANNASAAFSNPRSSCLSAPFPRSLS